MKGQSGDPEDFIVSELERKFVVMTQISMFFYYFRCYIRDTNKAIAVAGVANFWLCRFLCETHAQNKGSMKIIEQRNEKCFSLLVHGDDSVPSMMLMKGIYEEVLYTKCMKAIATNERQSSMVHLKAGTVRGKQEYVYHYENTRVASIQHLVCMSVLTSL